LDLGDPAIDSSFEIEFQINNDFSLVLEKTNARFLEHQSSATCWCCRVDNIEEVQYRSRLHGYTLNMEQRLYEGEVLYRCQDPEKNIFYIFLEK
jgi:hypothetical protein